MTSFLKGLASGHNKTGRFVSYKALFLFLLFSFVFLSTRAQSTNGFKPSPAPFIPGFGFIAMNHQAGYPQEPKSHFKKKNEEAKLNILSKPTNKANEQTDLKELEEMVEQFTTYHKRFLHLKAFPPKIYLTLREKERRF